MRDYVSLAQKILKQHEKPISYLTSKIDAVFGNSKEIIDNEDKRETRRTAFGATTIVKSTLDSVTGSFKPESVEIQRKNKNILVMYGAHGQIELIQKSEKNKDETYERFPKDGPLIRVSLEQTSMTKTATKRTSDNDPKRKVLGRNGEGKQYKELLGPANAEGRRYFTQTWDKPTAEDTRQIFKARRFDMEESGHMTLIVDTKNNGFRKVEQSQEQPGLSKVKIRHLKGYIEKNSTERVAPERCSIDTAVTKRRDVIDAGASKSEVRRLGRSGQIFEQQKPYEIGSKTVQTRGAEPKPSKDNIQLLEQRSRDRSGNSR